MAVSFDVQHLNSEKSGIYFPAGRLSTSKLQKGQEALKCEPCWKQINANKLHQLATWKYRPYVSEEDKEGSWGKPSWAVFPLNLGSVHRKGTCGCQVAINTQCEVGGLGAVVRTRGIQTAKSQNPSKWRRSDIWCSLLELATLFTSGEAKAISS